jgi:hypothetical protein
MSSFLSLLVGLWLFIGTPRERLTNTLVSLSTLLKKSIDQCPAPIVKPTNY